MLAHVAGEEDHLLDFFVEAGGRGLDPGGRGRAGRRSRSCSTRRRRCSTSARRRAASRARRPGCGRRRSAWCSMPFARAGRAGVQARARGRARDAGAGLHVHGPRADPDPLPGDARALRARGADARRPATCSGSPTSPTRSSGSAAEGPGWIYGGEVGERICDWVCERGGMLLGRRTSPPTRWSSARPVEAAYRGRARADEPAALLGRHPDRVRARPARALGRARSPFDDPDALALLAEVMAEAQRARGADFHDRLHEEGFAERVPLRPHLERAAARRASSGSRRAAARAAAASRSARRRTSRRSTRTATRQRHLLERHRLGRAAAGHRHPPEQHARRGGPEPARLPPARARARA